MDQNVLQPNNTAGLFDHLYLWKETTNVLDFFA